MILFGGIFFDFFVTKVQMILCEMTLEKTDAYFFYGVSFFIKKSGKVSIRFIFFLRLSIDLAGKVLRDSRSLDKNWSLEIGDWSLEFGVWTLEFGVWRLAGMSLKLLRNDFFFQLGKFPDLKIIS